MSEETPKSPSEVVANLPTEKKKLNYLARMMDAESADLDAFVFVIYLVVIANFCLGIALLNNLPFMNHKIPEQIVSSVILLYFFMFYLLFLIFTLRYVNRVRAQYRKDPVKFLIWSGVIGLAILSIASYYGLGIAATLNWFVPTIATLLLGIVLHLISKRQEKK